MKASPKKFVITFLVLVLIFQFISNALLLSEIRLFPSSGEWYPGIGSPIAWKNIVGTAIYPIKYILIEPLSFLTEDPDPVPPILLIAFAMYWAAIALVMYYLINVIKKMLSPKQV